MFQEGMNETAAMLAVCFEDAPVTVTVLPRVNAYNVRAQNGHCIWADDLPTGGYEALLRAMSLLLGTPQSAEFVEMFLNLSQSGSARFTAVGSFFFTGNLSIEGKAEHDSIILNVDRVK